MVSELTLWTRRFAVMVENGVPLLACLAALDTADIGDDLRAITRELSEAISWGNTLSGAMKAYPMQFDVDYLASIRAGEVGGILDKSLRRLAHRRETGLTPLPDLGAAQASRAELADWCWRFGEMLAAGVPVLDALATLAECAHPALAAATQEMHAEVAAGCSLAITRAEESRSEPQPAMWRYGGMFPPLLQRLTLVGVTCGGLSEMLLRAAEQLEWEAQLEVAGNLRLLSTAPAAAPAPVAPDVEHPVIRRVNDLLKTVVQSGVEWTELRPTDEGRGEAVMQKGEHALIEPLEQYPQILRRLKLLAGLDPLAHDEGSAYRRSQIYLRLEGKDYKLLVRSGGDRLALSLSEETGAVQL
jgi:hypothetical protein